MRIFVYFVYAAIFLSSFIAILNLILIKHKTSLVKVVEDKITNYNNSEETMSARFRKETMLLRRGADFFVLKDGFTLVKWYTDKLLVSVVFTGVTVLLCVLFKVPPVATLIAAVIIAIVGFVILDVILYVENKSSNKEMMNDIMEMSRSVLYSNRGGQYITKALSDAMLVVENERLKVALIRLKYNLDMHQPLARSIDEFESHFENAEISAFCTVIKSLQETGQVNDALSTLKANIEREQIAVNKRKCDRLENKTQLNCMLIFTGIVLCLVYMMFMFIAQVVTGF